MGREGISRCHPGYAVFNKKSCCDATGRRKPASLFSGTAFFRLIPLPCNGSSRSRLLIAFRLFNSEVHSASALLPGFHHNLPGSLKSALKRTRPRLRLFLILERIIERKSLRVKKEFPRQVGSLLNYLFHMYKKNSRD